MIQITQSKKEKISSLAEGIMSMAEKLTECVESLEQGGDAMGERSRYGYGRRYDEGDAPTGSGADRYGDRWEAYGDRMGTRRRYQY